VLTDYHTHTPLCLHAEGHPREYAAQARERGLVELGLSDHNPMPAFFDQWRMLVDDLPRYYEMVEEARAEHPGFPIRLALECDYLEGHERWIEQTAAMTQWDYLIGSVHYLTDEWAVDDPDPKHLSKWKSESDVADIWALYWKKMVKNARSGLFDIIAHPDLAKKFGHRPKGDLRRYYEPFVQALLDVKGVMEVSTAGLRKEVGEIYPARELVEMAHSAGIPIVINSDAHKPSEVGQDFAKALQLVREAGYTQTVRFSRREKTMVALPEEWSEA
jgi:histidinol-phosphatase (PHP family)